MRAEDIIEDIWTQVDNWRRGIVRDPALAMDAIAEICEKWGGETIQ